MKTYKIKLTIFARNQRGKDLCHPQVPQALAVVLTVLAAVLVVTVAAVVVVVAVQILLRMRKNAKKHEEKLKN